MYGRESHRPEDYERLLGQRYGVQRRVGVDAAASSATRPPYGASVSAVVADTSEIPGFHAPAADPVPLLPTQPDELAPTGESPWTGAEDGASPSAADPDGVSVPDSHGSTAQEAADVAGEAGTPPSTAPVAEPAPGPSPGRLSESDLAADLQAILGGTKLYDPESGGLRDRERSYSRPTGAVVAPQRRPVSPEEPAAQARPLPDAPDQHAIFDRIAQSMEHANAFDLGTRELKQRFESFDRNARQRTRNERSQPSRGHPGPVGAREFTEDLARMTDEPEPIPVPPQDFASVYRARGPWSRLPGRDAGCGPSAVALSLQRSLAVPMYDTGEHVVASEPAYGQRLHVSGVPFSYGQLVSLPDFYATVDDLLAAPAGELLRLRALVERSTEYYRNGRRSPDGNVSTEEWQEATAERYLGLAESNYAHFSPAAATQLSSGQRHPDNRSTWEALHARAIRQMQELVQAHPDSSPSPEGPLIVNAFADHFLTDAFAAGHLVNKEVVLARFRNSFFSGDRLNTAGRTFFKKLAERAFTGRVREQFSSLEPTRTFPLCAMGWCIPWRPNINSTSRFAELLIQAAEAEPLKIANLAVKALHDRLNTDGVEVVNDAGETGWRLTGDGTLNDRTAEIMRRAVAQSVANVQDPAIFSSGLDLAPLFARVWRHTPRPTQGGEAQLTLELAAHTAPTSDVLVQAAAEQLAAQLNSLIDVLLDSGALRPA